MDHQGMPHIGIRIAAQVRGSSHVEKDGQKADMIGVLLALVDAANRLGEVVEDRMLEA